MRFEMPHFPCEFEIPDDWLVEAGMQGFTPRAAAYRSAPNAIAVPLTEIEPPYRILSVPKDWRGFCRKRFVRILDGFVKDAEIEAVPLLELTNLSEFTRAPYRYRVRNGVHRFFASITAGFECLPADVVGG